MDAKGTDHRGPTDRGGIVLLIVLLAPFGSVFLLQTIRIVRADSSGGLLIAGLLVGIATFIWLAYAFYWVRGQLRVRGVRRMFPDAALCEVVMTDGLAATVQYAERLLGEPVPRIWRSTYLTVAAATDALYFFGGSFRPVLRGRIPASALSAVTVKTVDFPTQTVTRHFPAIVVTVDCEPALQLQMLPLRTTLFVARKLTASQLAAASVAVAASLSVPRIDN